MDGLVQYDALQRGQLCPDARRVLDILAQTYIVEFEPPQLQIGISEWYVQVRLPGEPVCAGYYGATASEAAKSVAVSLGVCDDRRAA
ncbi:MAG: hypothetical protein H6822_08810 [Planctomycetaceae bacterium]|nr:hypothetical protein [Planctomycetales bacterium]MCB9922269.1 hypothetical protein [Planctomycetaceae bacterium]